VGSRASVADRFPWWFLRVTIFCVGLILYYLSASSWKRRTAVYHRLRAVSEPAGEERLRTGRLPVAAALRGSSASTAPRIVAAGTPPSHKSCVLHNCFARAGVASPRINDWLMRIWRSVDYPPTLTPFSGGWVGDASAEMIAAAGLGTAAVRQ
jgi:hypothetical protein